jgi:hypothetical protein
MNVYFMTLSLPLRAGAGGSTTGVLHALDILGRLLGLSKRHILLAALGVLAAEQSNDRGIELVSSVQELELHEEEVAHDLTTNLLDEVSTCNCGATCECVSLEIRQARHS